MDESATTDLQIREATAADIPRLLDLIEEVFTEYNMQFVAEDEVQDFLNFDSFYPAKGRLFVAALDGKVIGCAAIKYDRHGAYFSRVYVQQAFRGRHVGKALTERLFSVAEEESIDFLHLWSDTRFRRAHRFYEKFGFDYSGRVRPLMDVNESYEYHYIYNPENNT